MNRYEFLIRFSIVSGQKSKMFRQFLLPSEDNFNEKPLLTRLGFNQQQIQQFYDQKVVNSLKWLEKDHHFLINYHDKAYPTLLKQISHPPLILFVMGNLNSLNTQQIAMVGSRQYSEYGAQWARYFARELASNYLTITSGLALGIDAICHRGALEASGQTIAVLGSGLANITPKTNYSLANDIMANNGAIISEFIPEQIAKPAHFPRRNRIISGLSMGTFVIEASQKSGSLITARYALEQNRDVFALPGNITQQNCDGTHDLIKQGAYLVSRPSDILAHYRHHLFWINHQTEVDVECLHPEILSVITHQTVGIDQIIEKTGLSVCDVSIKLTELELAGLIISVDGGYIRTRLV